MKKKLVILSVVSSLTPVLVLAQGWNTCQGENAGTVIGLLCRAGAILNAVVPVLIALGVFYFIWGVVSYVIASDEEAKKAGKNRMIYGIIGFAVIIAFWGLAQILTKSFGVVNPDTIVVPVIPVVQ